MKLRKFYGWQTHKQWLDKNWPTWPETEFRDQEQLIQAHPGQPIWDGMLSTCGLWAEAKVAFTLLLK